MTQSINKIFRIFFKIEIENHESSRNNVPFMPLYFCNAEVSAKDSVRQILPVASKYKWEYNSSFLGFHLPQPDWSEGNNSNFLVNMQNDDQFSDYFYSLRLTYFSLSKSLSKHGRRKGDWNFCIALQSGHDKYSARLRWILSTDKNPTDFVAYFETKFPLSRENWQVTTHINILLAFPYTEMVLL